MRIFFTLSISLLLTCAGYSQSGKPASDRPVIRFYPNPAVTQITFDFPKLVERTYTFQVYNFLGKKVHEQKDLQPKTTIDLSDYYRGIYIFQLRDKTGKIIETGRFQVAK
ncbi:T9SS type A sorting domain-containing protein [Flavihumibacter sp. CACIAM 22H1]|uniref:T9SS type A sorting domain-containing protein n=1 Tax=Flavihumibacter sp. CACIAM 22H1 TaxID=1812911 RepID=UPI0007A7F937|nr:T9SS type A sorting domain-containing protein [Flavihumibacter sp. CACIAM 22H1]KYP16228.1 MAG: hypothetical protein A1D16_14335 [Flavihumibacter sp. CACIAM 22H1]